MTVEDKKIALRSSSTRTSRSMMTAAKTEPPPTANSPAHQPASDAAPSAPSAPSASEPVPRSQTPPPLPATTGWGLSRVNSETNMAIAALFQIKSRARVDEEISDDLAEHTMADETFRRTNNHTMVHLASVATLPSENSGLTESPVESNDETSRLPARPSNHTLGVLRPNRPQESNGIAVPYSPGERREKVVRYLEKRRMRSFRKRIRYDVRKRLADTRPRVRGRFSKPAASVDQTA